MRLAALAAVALTVLLAALPAAPAAEAGGGLAVELRGFARSAGPFVRLDEVAELSGARAAQAGAVLLGRAPEAGRSRNIDRGTVERRLIEEGFEAGSFKVAGAQESKVASAAEGAPAASAENPAAPVKEQEKENAPAGTSPKERLAGLVAERIRADLAAVLGCPAADVEAKLQFPVEPDLPAGSARPVFELRWAGGKPRLGRQRLDIVLSAGEPRDKRGASAIVVLADLAVMRDVLVAVRDLAAGEAIPADGVRPARVNITDAAADYVKDAAELTGKCPARAVRAGAPVDRRALAKLILVRRGQPVTLLTQSGPVKVTETVVARSDGGLDEVVLVERLDDRKQLAGRVAGNGLVKTE
jgi:flagella basal body P-ring formation protein FlgA